MVKSYIEGTFHKYLDRHSLKLAFEKAIFFIETASPMDESRYYADQRKIDYFYETLGLLHHISCSMMPPQSFY